MAFTGICGPVDDPPEPKAQRKHVLGETQRMLRDDPDAWHALFDFLAAGWLADMQQVNGEVLGYNPSGRSFERMELRLMASQDTSDRLGVSGEEPASTAEELLVRATASARARLVSARASLPVDDPFAHVSELPVRMDGETSFAAAS